MSPARRETVDKRCQVKLPCINYSLYRYRINARLPATVQPFPGRKPMRTLPVQFD